MSYKINPLLATDSYKLGHISMYPEGTQAIYSNFTARSSKHFNHNVPKKYETNKIVFFGLQAVLQEMNDLWYENFFGRNFDEVKNEFLNTIKPFIGDNEFPIAAIKRLHSLGYLPIEIYALPEGSRVNIGVPVLTIHNTEPEYFWLTNYLETYLSNELWKPTTVATIADRYKALLMDYAEQTGASKEFVKFQGHDFSMRGMSGSLDSVKSGVGHLLSFVGSDNLLTPSYVDYYYYGLDNGLIACSVPASEHSIMCAGSQENEKETIRRIIQDKYPTGVVSVVSDSWDFFNVITNIASELKEVILNRGVDSNGLSKVIVRPDSGDPVRIICGYRPKHIESLDELYGMNIENELVDSDYEYFFERNEFDSIEYEGKYYKAKIEGDYDDGYYYFSLGKELSKQEVMGAVECLWETFRGTTNDLGFRTLNQKVGLIYGDSITLDRANDILEGLKQKRFASDNIVFGIGSYTYQCITRDTLGFAMKATYGIINGKPVEIFKNPKTDDGTKKSAKGLLKVTKKGTNYILHDQVSEKEMKEDDNCLIQVYDKGILFKRTFSQIRDRLENE